MEDFDRLIPFCCLPPDNENEWIILKPFVENYNSIFNKNYSLKSFPENENRNSPEPEILLCDGNLKMVIERKIIPLPPSYIRTHQLWHEFHDRITNNIIDEFLDDLYEFRIQDVNLPDNKKEAISLADEISGIILEYKERIKAPEGRFSGGIYSDGLEDSIPWGFFIVSDFEKEDHVQDTGIFFKLGISWKIYNDQELEKELPQLKYQLSKLIQNSVKKFDKYSDCLKILIIEPYSDFLKYPVDLLINAINNLDIPNNLDQIWITEIVEINDYESFIDYRMIINNT